MEETYRIQNNNLKDTAQYHRNANISNAIDKS